MVPFPPIPQTMLVDNSPHAYGYDVDNGIPIESWFENQNDTELLKLLDFLKTVEGEDDVRGAIREHFKSYQLVERALLGQAPTISCPPF